MKKSMKLKYNGAPFISGFCDVEKEDINIEIGRSDVPDNLLFGDFDYPDQLTVLCDLDPIAEFDKDIQISAKYRISKDLEKNPDESFMMSRRLYDESSLKMKGVVSAIDIVFKSALGSFPEEDKEYFKQYPSIYRKTFETQKSSREISTSLDTDFGSCNDGITDIMHFQSKAYFFAGAYHDCLPVSEIQPYMFYMGTGFRAQEYIALISAKEYLNSQKVIPSNEITEEKLSSLVDDVAEGKVVLSIPDKFSYRSIDITKSTITSGLCKITFERIEQ